MNSIWEDKLMSLDLKRNHNDVVSKMGIPQWVLNLRCLHCENPIDPRSIRSIGMQFNAKNLGDVCIEICCENCNRMDVSYYRSETECVSDFIKLLEGAKEPTSTPIDEMKMHRTHYNNLLENYILKEGK